MARRNVTSAPAEVRDGGCAWRIQLVNAFTFFRRTQFPLQNERLLKARALLQRGLDHNSAARGRDRDRDR